MIHVSQVESMSDRYMENHSESYIAYGMHRFLWDVIFALNSVNLLPWQLHLKFQQFLTIKIWCWWEVLLLKSTASLSFCGQNITEETKFCTIISSSLIFWTERENSEIYGIQIQRRKCETVHHPSWLNKKTPRFPWYRLYSLSYTLQAKNY